MVTRWQFLCGQAVQMEMQSSYMRDPDPDILWLAPQEDAWIDCDALTRLTVELGREAARDSLWQALDSLNGALAAVAEAWSRDDLSAVEAALAKAEPELRVLGMEMATHVARDVAQVLARGDDAALAATIARLLRLGDAGAAAFCAGA